MLAPTTPTIVAAAGVALALLAVRPQALGQKRARGLGISPGILNIGKYNPITDVAGVRVGRASYGLRRTYRQGHPGR
jgi:hypothetical protein